MDTVTTSLFVGVIVRYDKLRPVTGCPRCDSALQPVSNGFSLRHPETEDDVGLTTSGDPPYFTNAAATVPMRIG